MDSCSLRPSSIQDNFSAAILKMTESHFDMVRPGIAQFGLHPDPVSCRLPSTFQPALQWKTEIAQVNHITSGESVGYGQEFMAANPMVIATIPVGYADGFPRRPSNWGHVMVAGKFASILGRVCMDQTMIDITDHVLTDGMARNEEHKAQSLNQGDEVVLIGQQGDAELTVDNIAQQLGTNNFDVVSRILSRVPRIYI